MREFKYEIPRYHLFDYIGVEKHLEKMAAKGWRLTSIGDFFWIYKRTEPEDLKYSVTYIPETSEFDPEPLEKQRDIEAYCEAAGWKKVDRWMQMQIFCSDNPEAVPIETDENLRLEAIHKSIKKNMLFSKLLLLFVFAFQLFRSYSIAKNNWITFLSDSNQLYVCGIWLWGIMMLAFEGIYYLGWRYKSQKAIKKGLSCPEPKVYRYMMRACWIGLLVLIFGIVAADAVGMGIAMVVAAGCCLLILIQGQKIQERLKRERVSKTGNAIFTGFSGILLCILVFGGLIAVLEIFDVSFTKRTIEADTMEIDGKRWDILYDTQPLPLYVEDFVDAEAVNSSRWVKTEQETVLAGYGEYHSDLFIKNGSDIEVISAHYEVITAKAGFLYEFLLDTCYEQEFQYAEEVEKMEYRVTYKGEGGTMYRQYYNGLPVAHQWLILTNDKIIPIRIYLEDLSQEQMKRIMEKLSE